MIAVLVSLMMMTHPVSVGPDSRLETPGCPGAMFVFETGECGPPADPGFDLLLWEAFADDIRG